MGRSFHYARHAELAKEAAALPPAWGRAWADIDEDPCDDLVWPIPDAATAASLEAYPPPSAVCRDPWQRYARRERSRSGNEGGAFRLEDLPRTASEISCQPPPVLRAAAEPFMPVSRSDRPNVIPDTASAAWHGAFAGSADAQRIGKRVHDAWLKIEALTASVALFADHQSAVRNVETRILSLEIAVPDIISARMSNTSDEVSQCLAAIKSETGKQIETVMGATTSQIIALVKQQGEVNMRKFAEQYAAIAGAVGRISDAESEHRERDAEETEEDQKQQEKIGEPEDACSGSSAGAAPTLCTEEEAKTKRTAEEAAEAGVGEATNAAEETAKTMRLARCAAGDAAEAEGQKHGMDLELLRHLKLKSYRFVKVPGASSADLSLTEGMDFYEEKEQMDSDDASSLGYDESPTSADAINWVTDDLSDFFL